MTDGNESVNPHGQHLYFYAIDRNSVPNPWTHCIAADELEWYAQYGWDAVTLAKNHCDLQYYANNREYIRYSVEGYIYDDSPGDGWNTHGFPITYGNAVDAWAVKPPGQDL